VNVIVFYLDSDGKRRGWARGPEEELDAVRGKAQESLQRYIEKEAQTGAALAPDDFQEFVARVRETS
jgi:hypothetical protein